MGDKKKSFFYKLGYAIGCTIVFVQDLGCQGDYCLKSKRIRVYEQGRNPERCTYHEIGHHILESKVTTAEHEIACEWYGCFMLNTTIASSKIMALSWWEDKRDAYRELEPELNTSYNLSLVETLFSSIITSKQHQLIVNKLLNK